MHTYYIGIGSNINAEENLLRCAQMLREAFPGITFSSIYSTAARDVEDQDDFLNAVAKMETEKDLDEIAVILQKIESDLGKDVPYEKGPRTIDLDILLTSNQQQTTNNSLEIPHPRMHERRFVLEPLCELNDEAIWKEKLEEVQNQECKKVKLDIM